MFAAIFVLLLFPIFVIIGIIGALTGKGGKQKPAPKDPIDRHMDENYADINWLRKGKL